MDAEFFTKHLRDLPINPSIAAKVLEMVENQQYSFANLESLISADPGLTARILKIANSSLYARPNEIIRLQSAIAMLGMKNIKNIVILVTGASLFKRYEGGHFFSLFWRHSLRTAFASRALSLHLGMKEVAEEAFIGGLLHNIGQVALYLHDPETYNEILQAVLDKNARFSEIEYSYYQTNHKEIGRYILAKWNFPEVYCHCTGDHGDPNAASPWKRIVLVVSCAAFFSGNRIYCEEHPRSPESLKPLLLQLGAELGDLEEWEQGFHKTLEKDLDYQSWLSALVG